jgi:phage FluMu gp28-like protein
MKHQPHIFLIGIDPLLLDFSLPDFSAMPGLTAEKIEMGTKAALDELNNLGYIAEKCWVDLGSTASETVIAKLKEKTYDGIIIGAGIRVAESNFLLFEKIVNTIHEHAPQAKIVFNTSPKDNVAAVKRYILS